MRLTLIREILLDGLERRNQIRRGDAQATGLLLPRLADAIGRRILPYPAEILDPVYVAHIRPQDYQEYHEQNDGEGRANRGDAIRNSRHLCDSRWCTRIYSSVLNVFSVPSRYSRAITNVPRYI